MDKINAPNRCSYCITCKANQSIGIKNAFITMKKNICILDG